MRAVDLAEVAIRPEPGDNVAIVTQQLPAGTRVRLPDTEVVLSATILEGHRIVVEPIGDSEPLLSWSTPFARAHGNLSPGDYVCTTSSLALLRERGVKPLPQTHTATNEPLDPYRLDESTLRLGEQVSRVEEPATFLGYPRRHGPAGTRNHLVVIGVTSRSASFVTELSRRLAQDPAGGFDGVAPVAHTEAGEERRPNNVTMVLSALAGFLVHPNVGAALVVDEPGAALTAEDVWEFMRAGGYPELRIPHARFTRDAGFEQDLGAAAALVQPWIARLERQRRTEQPLSDLRIALQCGGSDAFSGVTANPLAGAVAAEVIRHGGSAVLAETDELIGAEGYVLKNVRSAEVARQFLGTVERFKERAGWHGQTAEGNPSGGNVYRGLYNIVLKSVGAARKLDRDVRLDHVIDYATPVSGPGFTFMDSPGNDLESVAGQVASGCNLIFFTTGNGSITNFPFVPTLKFVTTSERYRLLSNEMDVDAGRLLDGLPMADLTAEVFQTTLRTASGERSAGEHAGHSQVSIWRNWKQTGVQEGIALTKDARIPRRPEELPAEVRDADLDGSPLDVPRGLVPDSVAGHLSLYDNGGRRGTEQLALVLPTSLCSGQVALRLVDEATQGRWHGGKATRVVALPHTEGCGVSGGPAEHTYVRMMTGYLAHPNVRMALLLEHGCEKTHNDYFRARMAEVGLDPDAFGWASIQGDGGVEGVTERVREWFEERASRLAAPRRVEADLDDLVVAVDARGPVGDETARAFAAVAGWVVAKGGSVILPAGGTLTGHRAFCEHAFGHAGDPATTLAHGQRPRQPGWHVMRMPTADWLEVSSGLGAAGAHVLLTHVGGATVSGHRLVPVVQVSADESTTARFGKELDGSLSGGWEEQARCLLSAAMAVVRGERMPRTIETRNVGFQVTRGLLGTSM